MTWVLIETLAPGEMSIVAKGGTPRSLSEKLALQRLSPDPKILVVPFVERALAAGTRHEEFKDVVRRGGGVVRYRMLALPVAGPTGAVHALQVWIAPADVQPDPPRYASGVSWLLERGVTAQTVEASLMSGVPPSDHVPERTPAEYYAKTVRFDGAAEMIELCLDPKPGRTWEGSFSVLHADGRVMRWHAHARACTIPGEVGARILWHDVTDTIAPDKPVLDVVARQRGMEALGIYPALLAPGPGILALWLCDEPAPWVHWRDVDSGETVIHPDDLEPIRSAHARLRGGSDHDEITVRLRASSPSDEWAPTRMRISAYPGDLADHLVVVDMYRP